MEYPREGKPEVPFNYMGYNVQIITFERMPGDWVGSYRLSRDGVDLVGATVGNVFDDRAGALENVTRIAKGEAEVLSAKGG